MSTQTIYRAVTAYGVQIETFATRDKALTWEAENTGSDSQWPGAYVEQVTTTINRRRIGASALRLVKA